MRIVDLRSDTVTKPTPRMREAMMSAEVGDDGFREDPTVNKLEEIAAKKLGKEAALFVSSGTMGNLIAIMVHTRQGDGVICDRRSHLNMLTGGGTSAIAGVTTCPIGVDTQGRLDLDELVSNIRPNDMRFPRTTLIVFENTNNLAGGTVITTQDTKELVSIANKYGLHLHLDGARIFNSAVAQGVDPKELTKGCDSVMFCLTKGLASPIGAILAGPEDFIIEARRKRKLLGGGTRQAGVIAACGIISLEEMIDRLAEDHKNARFLAEGLSKIDGFTLNLSTVQTNIVCFNLKLSGLSCKDFIKKLKDNSVLAVHMEGSFGRMVTHKDVNADDIAYALERIEETVDEAKQTNARREKSYSQESVT
ncbi:MAG TPA: GntG family PLP-dependent aldolase [Candidatus Brocadiia bacterium]|nr:aminotransferase class I/II-fold pyridoxal phosphate-dependent enzyme [Planctomycetota bacterium]MDO8093554.1 GntG family PLP-dependent aldolase [Candidatus Brocadiales bacterium]